MRERQDRGLEPIGAVIVRVIEHVAYLWQHPWLEQKNIAKKNRRPVPHIEKEPAQ